MGEFLYRDSSDKNIAEGILRLISTGQRKRAEKTFLKFKNDLAAKTRTMIQKVLLDKSETEVDSPHQTRKAAESPTYSKKTLALYTQKKEFPRLPFPDPPEQAESVNSDFFARLTEGQKRIFQTLFQQKNSVVSLTDLALAFFQDSREVGEKEDGAIKSLICALQKKLKAENFTQGLIKLVKEKGYTLQTKSWLPLEISEKFTHTENKILQMLCAWERQIVTFEDLVTHVWGEDSDVQELQPKLMKPLMHLREGLRKWGGVIASVEGIGVYLNLQSSLPDELQNDRLVLSLHTFMTLSRLNENSGKPVQRRVLREDYTRYRNEKGSGNYFSSLSLFLSKIQNKIRNLGSIDRTVSKTGRSHRLAKVTLHWKKKYPKYALEDRELLLPRGTFIPGIRKLRPKTLLEEGETNSCFLVSSESDCLTKRPE